MITCETSVLSVHKLGLTSIEIKWSWVARFYDQATSSIYMLFHRLQ